MNVNYSYVRKHWWQLPVSCCLQWLLWKCGISWHNFFRNECTPDFSCCTKRKTGKMGLDAIRDLMKHEFPVAAKYLVIDPRSSLFGKTGETVSSWENGVTLRFPEGEFDLMMHDVQEVEEFSKLIGGKGVCN